MTTQTLTPVMRRGRGTTFMVVSSLFFASSGPLAKAAMDAGLQPTQVTIARIGIAAVVLLGVFALARPQVLRVRRGDLPVLLGYGLLGVGGTQLFYFLSVSRIPVGVAMLLEYLSPVLVTLWARFVRGTRLAALTWGGTALAIVGLAMIGQVWDGLRLDLLGVLLGLATAVCSASYFLIGEHAVADRDPLGLVTWGMLIAAVPISLLAPPWSLPADVVTASTPFGPWHPPVWLLLCLVALVSTVCAFLMGISALRYLPSTVASVISLLEAVIATALAWLLLGEALTVVQLVGAVVLLSGAILVQLTSKNETVVEPVPEPDVAPR